MENLYDYLKHCYLDEYAECSEEIELLLNRFPNLISTLKDLKDVNYGYYEHNLKQSGISRVK